MPSTVTSQPRQSLRFGLAAIWALAIAVALLSPGSLVPSTPGLPHLDKLGHALLFAPGGWLLAPRPILALSASASLALGTEIGQEYVPGRSRQVGDVAADLLGALAGFVLARRGSRT